MEPIGKPTGICQALEPIGKPTGICQAQNLTVTIACRAKRMAFTFSSSDTPAIS